MKSGIWADSLSRGLIDLNISARKRIFPTCYCYLSETFSICSLNAIYLNCILSILCFNSWGEKFFLVKTSMN